MHPPHPPPKSATAYFSLVCRLIKFLAVCLREISIKGPFLPTCGFANQGKGL